MDRLVYSSDTTMGTVAYNTIQVFQNFMEKRGNPIVLTSREYEELESEIMDIHQSLIKTCTEIIMFGTSNSKERVVVK
jgi:hypothetical protein